MDVVAFVLDNVSGEASVFGFERLAQADLVTRLGGNRWWGLGLDGSCRFRS